MSKLFKFIFIVYCLFTINAVGSALDTSPSVALSLFSQYANAANNQQYSCPNPIFDSGIRKKLTPAFDWYLVKAKQGDSQAQYYVGLAYLYNLGPNDSNSINKAIFWFNKAASQNNALAMRQLGYIDYSGNGAANLGKMWRKALEWYSKAAKLGDVPSLILMANIYYQGATGYIPQDINKANSLIKQAAAKNSDIGQAGLAGLYFDGQGEPKDYAKALSLYQQALQGSTLPSGTRVFVYERLADMYNLGLGTAKDLVKAKAFLTQAEALKKQEQCLP